MNEESDRKMRGRSRGRTRGRARGRTRGRTKKPMKIIDSDEEDSVQTTEESQRETTELSTSTEQVENVEDVEQIQPPREHQFDLEADISQLEAPTFTTINRGPPEPMLRLRWDHRVNLIGEKVLNPMIHCCDKCLKPILIYGRMIPCKHVFCLSCGKREDKVCPRCMEKVSRVEQTGLGTVFMCTHGGTRYGNAGCRRTYLSQRDLQAHINHRHISGINQIVSGCATQNESNQYIHSKAEVEQPQLHQQQQSQQQPQQQQQIGKISSVSMQAGRIKQIPPHVVQPILGSDPRVNSIVNQSPIEHRQQHRTQQLMPIQTYSSNSGSSINPPMRTNLITVPIQDTTVMSHEMHTQQTHHYYQPSSSQINYGYNVPLVPQQSQNYYPVQQHPGQISYSTSGSQQQQQQSSQSQSQTQQQQVQLGPPSIRSSTNGYIQDNNQYSTPPPPQQIPTAQSQWSQHQQFYR